MDLEHVKMLISKGESEVLEFKTTTAELKKACQTLCGFLNHQGGTVLIGVKPDGRLVGQMVTDNTRLEIANELRHFEPSPGITVQYVEIEANKSIIVITAFPSAHQPYVYDGRPYIRVQSSTSVMGQDAYEQRLVQRGKHHYSWEDYLAEGYTIADLDETEIQHTVSNGITVGRLPPEARTQTTLEVLSSLDLVRDGQLKNAAVILYAKKITSLYSHCMLKMARFIGLSKTGDFLDNKEFYGNAFSILREAEVFMGRHLSIASSYSTDSFVRIDKPTLPILAVREALINAICHRDYANRGTEITLAIFDDRLEIWNSGQLPPGLEVGDLQYPHTSQRRNKLIANVFYRRGFIEAWGTGTLKIFEECREHGIAPPSFTEYSRGVSVEFRFAEVMQRMGEQDLKKSEDLGDLTARQKIIISFLEQNGETKLSTLLEHFKLSVPERTLRNDLTTLRALGRVDSHGRGRHAVWLLKIK